jgi:hypothetical protein
MNKELFKELLEKATTYRDNPNAVGEYKHFPWVDYEKLVEAVVEECILTIQLKIIRNGDTPENNRSFKHVEDIANKFDIKLPLKPPKNIYDKLL